MLQRAWCLGVLAVVVAVACGGSNAAQRSGDSSSTGVSSADSDVGGGAQADDSDGADRDGGDAKPADDPTDGLAGGVDDGTDAPDDGTDGTGGPADTTPAAAPEQEDARFKTSETREKMSEFLVKPAEAAMKDSDYALAVSLYSGIVAARGKGDPAALQLATAWNLQRQFDEAARVLDEFAAAAKDAKARSDARERAAALRDRENPFAMVARPAYARKQAVDAFKLGRKAQNKKKWADALVYFKMASAIDPTLAGPVREIGTCYGKLGATEEKVRYLLDYLWRSPMGSFAADVRKELKKMKRGKELGTLSVNSKLACDEVWVVGQYVKQKLPIKNLEMAPGSYKWLCFAPKYAMAYFESVTVEAGKHADLEFHWAIIVNKLDNPWGRISIQDVRNMNAMKYLGIETEEVGILVPKDGSALKMELRDPKDVLQETRYVRIPSGTREVVKWKK